MLGIFGRSKPLTEFETLSLERKTLSQFKQIHYIMELEGKICSLDPQYSNNGNLRKAVARLNDEYNAGIYQEVCNCANKQRAKLNKNGTPRVHKAYIRDWAL